MNERLRLDFCEISIFDNYLIVVMDEGVNLVPDDNQVLMTIVENHFPNTPFVYITHRINSYSVDPKIYLETSKILNLKGFAVVSSNYQAKINAQIEQLFFDKPFEIFSKIEDARSWADQIVKNE